MAGYDNFSMSNNARDAYRSGEMPMSKWTKQDILRAAKQTCPAEIFPLIQKVSASVLRDRLLSHSSWHHTSSHYNQTDFYSVVDCSELTAEQVMTWGQKKQEMKPDPVEEQQRKAEYLEWSGTKSHPKATRYESTGIMKGTWFYLPNGSKKSILARGFRFLD